MIRVARHAIDRYRERVADIPEDEARTQIVRAVENARAIEFGAPYVKLGTGQHIVIENGVIVTVLPKDQALFAFSFKAHIRRIARRLME